jgi:hypothetical protein
VWFDININIDVEPREPSPWLTFFSLRALDWWDSAAAA